MAVLDSFIKGYQDGQSRSDTLKDRALQLKQLQEEKARQAQQDAQERAMFGLQYVDKISKDPEWWKVNGDNQEAIGGLLAKRNTFEQALNLPLTSALTDVRQSLFATTWAELQPKLASGEITDDAAYELMKAKVGEDVIGKQTMNLANSAVLQNGGKDDVLKLQLPEVAPLKLTKSVAPVFTLPKTGDDGVDKFLEDKFRESGIQGVRDFVKNAGSPEHLSSIMSGSLYGSGDMSAGGITSGIMGDILANAKIQVKAYIDNYDSEMAIHQRNIESDKAEQARWEAETDKRNYVLSKGHTTFAGIPGFKLMLATTYNKGEGDRKRAEFDKRVASYDINTVEGVKQKDWAEATAKGWTTLPFDEWKRSNAGEAMSAKNAVADYRQLESSLKILQSVAAKYGSTPEEQARFNADYGPQIHALKTKLASINKATDPMLDPLTGWIDIKTGSSEADQLRAQATKERIDISEQQLALSTEIFKSNVVQRGYENAFTQAGLDLKAKELALRAAEAQIKDANGNIGKEISWTNVAPRGEMNAVSAVVGKVSGKPLLPAYKFGLVIDPYSNGNPRSMAIFTKYKQFAQFLRSRNILGDTNGETFLDSKEMQNAIDSDGTIPATIEGYINEINSLTKSYLEKYPWFSSTTYTDRGGLPLSKTPPGMPTITDNGNGTATASVSGGKPIDQTKLAPDGVGRTERFAPLNADYEVYKAKNGYWYQRSKHNAPYNSTGGKTNKPSPKQKAGGAAGGSQPVRTQTIKGPDGKPIVVKFLGRK